MSTSGGPRDDVAAKLYRVAVAVARPFGADLFDDLMREAAASLDAAAAFVAVYADAAHKRMRALAVQLDGLPLRPFEYELAGSPCERVVGTEFIHVPNGVLAAFRSDTVFAAKGMDAYAALPLCDRDGAQLGLLAVMDRAPLRDAVLAEAVLKILGSRIAAEIDRMRSDEALRRSEESYRAIFEASEDAIVIHDWDTGAMIDCNAKALELSGYSRSEVQGQTVEQYSVHGGPQALAEAKRYRALAQAGETPTFEWRRRNRDGTLHWDEVKLKAVVLAGVPRILSFSREITERKEADEALRAREEQYRAIFEAASDGFVLRDAQFRTLDANPAFYRMYGFSARTIEAGGGYPAHFPPHYVQEREAQVRRALAGQETHVETVALRADGTPFWIDLRVIPVRYRGEPHVLQVARDITALRERELALQRSEARLRATMDAAFDAVVSMDPQGRIVEFNAAAERCFGHARAAVIGQPLGDLIVPKHLRHEHAQGVERHGHHGTGRMIGRLVETVALHADGTEFPVELAVSVAATPDGYIYVGHLRDITERKRSEERRSELERQLRQAQKMEAIGQLAGGIAHDFNNILTSVTGYVVMAMERAESLQEATIARQLGHAHTAAERARQLIAQMLAFSRRQRTERRTLSLPAELQRSMDLLRSMLPRSVDLQVAVEPDAAAVVGDSVQIEQVLLNLCINARDAVDGTGSIRVRVSSESIEGSCSSCRAALRGAWTVISVTDSGAGIAPALAERMFEPFYTTKPAGRGSGMGLAMVHGIVHEHDGHVLVDNVQPHGARFRVLLPPSAAVAEAAPQRPADVPPRSALAGRVLLVEDEPSVAGFMVELLESWGLQVTYCADARAADEHLQVSQSPFDVLLTDHTMPGTTGLELARRATDRHPMLPVLLYTGFGEDIEAAALQRARVRAMLRKPIDREALRSELERVLQR